MADGTDIVQVAERWYGAAELTGLPGMPGTDRGVRKLAAREKWSARSRASGKGSEYPFTALPPATQAALLLRETRAAPVRHKPNAPSDAQIHSLWARYERVKQPLKDAAAQRLKALHALESLIRSGTPVLEARAIVAAQLRGEGLRGTSVASLARWQKAVAGAHPSDRLALLVPHYAGRTVTAECSPEAWAYFKCDWLRVEAPSATSCYERTKRVAAVRGWTVPSLRTLERRIERELPRGVRVLARQGEEAMEKLYPAQQRDRSMFAALEGVNADGHRWDVMVQFPDGTIGRPSILGWQDLYSGKMLAYRLCDNESSDAVRLSFADMVKRYGIPGAAWLDNGRAFAAKWMTGGTPNRYRFKVREEDPTGLITALVGPENVHWVTPYHGQAKPIERAWRDFCADIAKHPAFAGAYTGNNPMAKPENYGSRAVPWDEFVRVVADGVAAHNAREGRRSAVCRGRSFDVVFNESYARATVRKVTDEQLRSLLLAAEAVTASRLDGSVRLAGNRYWTEALSACAGQRVVLRVDPEHLHGSVYVYAMDGTYIAEAECVASVGFADTTAAREHARGKSQFKRAQKQMLEAENRMEIAELASQLPAPPPENLPAAGVIAPVFRHHGKPRKAPEEPAMAATGTDGLTSAERFVTRLSEKLSDI